MFPKDHVRVFKNPLLEVFTYVPWYFPALMYGPIALGLSTTQIQTYHTPATLVVLQIVFGFVLWTFSEYVLHRFFFHLSTHTPLRAVIQKYAHGLHHDHPTEKYRLVAPPAMSLSIGIVLYAGLMALLPAHLEGVIFAGLLLGYLNYEWTHYSTHHVTQQTGWGRYLRKLHMLHHFKYPDKLFGVSSPLWDVVFGTYVSQRQT